MLTEDRTRFDEIWPEVFRRAVKALRRKAVTVTAAEDAVQEAGARALALDVAYEDVDDLLRWIQTVAWRIVVDAQKRERRLVYDMPEPVSTEDIGDAVEARLRLERLRALIGDLAPEDQAALGQTPRGSDRRTSVRLAVRRHRVRAQLIALLDGVAAVAGIAGSLVHQRSKHRSAALGTLLVAATVLTFAPFALEPSPKVSGVDRAERAVVRPAPTAPVRGVSVHEPVLRMPPRSSDRPRGDLPRLDVVHPGLDGHGQIWGRPKEAGDHFVCLALLTTAERCVDSPVQLTG